jgi:hypothetical protein
MLADLTGRTALVTGAGRPGSMGALAQASRRTSMTAAKAVSTAT